MRSAIWSTFKTAFHADATLLGYVSYTIPYIFILPSFFNCIFFSSETPATFNFYVAVQIVLNRTEPRKVYRAHATHSLLLNSAPLFFNIIHCC
jgi:hypothetical protein